MRKKALCYLAVTLNATTMKKALFISLCVLLLAGTGCKKNVESEPQKVAVTGVAVIPRSVTLKVGETKEIIATITPANADNQNVSWSTSNSSVATVADGLITAVGAGEATITVTTVDGGKTATCAVTVSAVVVPVTGIKIDQGATAEVEEGNTITLTATVQPENATDKTVTWSSSNDAIATVANGVVTGVTPGEAVITAKAGDKTATCTVTVNSAIPAYEAVDLGLSVKWANKNLGAEFPEDAGDYYAWGELETKPVYSWNSYKFLTAEGGYISKYTMDAWEAATVDYLTLLEEEDDVAHKILGDKWRLPTPAEWNELHNHTNRQNSQNGMYAKASNGNSIFLPYGGMYYSNDGAELYLKGREGFYWTSSLGNINSYARCAWLAGGDINMSIFIVRSAGLSIRAVYGERPPVPVGGIELDPTTKELKPGEQFTIIATVLPESAADKTISWSSSDETIATVANGVVTGVAPGEAVITAKAGDKTVTCTVTVKAALPTDALSGEFSVSGNKKVHFSQGNLVATINASGTPTAWKFAANQYDYIGSATANTSIGSTAGDIDLFGWSTAATKYGISTSTSLSDYSGDFVDWGTAIDDKGTWRTLTTAEWQYLFNRRSNASSLYKNGVTVCGKENCLIIAPDNWDTSAKPLNASYDATAWATAEAAGLVCLPAAGSRSGSDVGDVGRFGTYWSSSAYGSTYACYVSYSYVVYPDFNGYRSYGLSVRLITESK